MAQARSDVPDTLRIQAPEVLVEVYCLQVLAYAICLGPGLCGRKVEGVRDGGG